jgi:small subunit ribosomal protein S12e
MSDYEEEPVIVDQEEIEEVEEVEVEEPLTKLTALAKVLKTSLHADGLARGLAEAVKALDRREAHLCVLAKSNEKAYGTLIEALCTEHKIPMVGVDDRNVLGEWAGLCKFNAEGQAVKVVGCSCVVIREWGADSEARSFLLSEIGNK